MVLLQLQPQQVDLGVVPDPQFAEAVYIGAPWGFLILTILKYQPFGAALQPFGGELHTGDWHQCCARDLLHPVVA